jgi:hypothetical protein
MKKKLIGFVVLLLLAVGLGLGIRLLWRAHRATRKLPELRAVMKDEDEPRPIEPSLAIQVNEDKEAAVFAGTPVWFEIDAANQAAMNDVAGTQELAKKIARLQAAAAQGHARPEQLKQAMADYQKRTAPSTITLGDSSHRWTDAVEFVVRDDKGVEKPLSLALKLLGSPPQTVALDLVNTAQATFGVAAADIAPGTYSIAGCLAATGSWHGRTCSNAVKLTVEPRPNTLTADQHLALDKQKARYGLQAGDYDAVETYGRDLVKANPNSVPGHIYLGDAALGKGKNDVALQEYLTASAQYDKQYPDAEEQPVYLITRISQLIQKSTGTK